MIVTITIILGSSQSDSSLNPTYDTKNLNGFFYEIFFMSFRLSKFLFE